MRARQLGAAASSDGFTARAYGGASSSELASHVGAARSASGSSVTSNLARRAGKHSSKTPACSPNPPTSRKTEDAKTWHHHGKGNLACMRPPEHLLVVLGLLFVTAAWRPGAGPGCSLHPSHLHQRAQRCRAPQQLLRPTDRARAKYDQRGGGSREPHPRLLRLADKVALDVEHGGDAAVALARAGALGGHTIGALLRVLRERRAWRACLSVLRHVQRVSPGSMTNSQLTMAIGACGAAGQWRHALGVLDEFTSLGRVPSTAGRRARPPSSRRRGLQSRRNTASSSTPRARTRTRARARMQAPTRTRAGIS